MIFESFMEKCAMMSDFHVNAFKIVLLCYGITLAHFIASNIYASVCTTYSLRGYIMMPFMIVTPHCSALRWIIHHTGEQIGRWWIWLGGYLVLHITKTIPAYLQMKPLEKEENTDDETTQTTRRERRKNGIN